MTHRYCPPIRTFDDFWGRAGLPPELKLEAIIIWDAAIQVAAEKCEAMPAGEAPLRVADAVRELRPGDVW